MTIKNILKHAVFVVACIVVTGLALAAKVYLIGPDHLWVSSLIGAAVGVAAHHSYRELFK